MGDVIIDGLTGANRLVILDANGKIPALDGSNVTLLAGANFSTGTIPVARIDTGTAAGKVVKLDGNAKLPAVSGAALTGITGATKNASNPVIATNPSGGVGTEWQNTTTGEIFICTDATAGANVWTSTGGRSGNITPWSGGWTTGTQYGYAMGGYISSAASDIIQKYSFTSDGNSTDVANITVARYRPSGCSSSTYGYASGGNTGSMSNIIDKHQYGTSNNSTDVGDLTLARNATASCEDSTHGYVMGGANPTLQNIIERYPFASDTNASDVGDMSQIIGYVCGSASSTHGYTHGGGVTVSPATYGTDKIYKFSLASSANSTLYSGVLTSGYSDTYNFGTGSRTHGYTYGRWTHDGSNPTSGFRDTIDKFSYATEANATDVGNLVVARAQGSASSSTTHGYMCGGRNLPSNVLFNEIEKHSFTTDGNATDVGDMLSVGQHFTGNQY